MSTRKQGGQRQGRGTADVGTVVPLARPTPPPPHPTNRKLLAATVRAWTTFWASPMSALVDDADMLSLGRLFHMYDMRERLERMMLDAPVVAGSKGQPVLHPAAAEIASLDGRIDRLEPRFGITPKGRLELGITFGAASKSLEEMNRAFDDEDAGEEDDDPRRVTAIDAKSRKA